MSDEVSDLRKVIEELIQKQQLQEEEIEGLKAEIESLRSTVDRLEAGNNRGFSRRRFEPRENMAQLLYGPPERLRRRREPEDNETI